MGAAAKFNNPTGIAVDIVGNLYVTDKDNHRIRKITPSGTVSTFAGLGSYGFADGAAVSAQFSNPEGITIDAERNLYIADRLNHRIRKITQTGIVSTVAGIGNGFIDNVVGNAARFDQPQGLTIDAQGNIYTTDRNNHRIRKINSLKYGKYFGGFWSFRFYRWRTCYC